jgi:predicted dehydrogenase
MQLSRRDFVKGAASISGLTFLPKRVFGANERVNVAFIGAGGRGNRSILSMENNQLVNIVAFADVDEVRAAETYKALPKVPRYRDFRKMLERHDKDIDAVVISTPDHTHHYAAKWCMKMAKHVYLEKPLAHTIDQCRDLAALEAQYGVACQMGNQGHSGPGIALLKAWIDAGALGEITEMQAWNPGGRSIAETNRPAAEPIPETFDWDLWLGPAKEVPYSSQYCPSSWRWWFDFGEGTIGDWACHNMDAPYFALDLGIPNKVKIKSTGASKLSFPSSAEVIYKFYASAGQKAVTLKWYSGPDLGPERPAQLEDGRQLGSNGGGSLIIGSKATVMMGGHAGSPRIIPEAKHREMSANLPRVDNRSSHYDNWLLACKGEEKSRSHFAYSARLTEVMHYGNIAMHVDRDLKIDPVKRQILGDEQASQLASGTAPRKGWQL